MTEVENLRSSVTVLDDAARTTKSARSRPAPSVAALYHAVNTIRGEPVSSIEERLAIIEAKDEIRELTARYCHAVVDGDVEAIIELFCRDGVFRMRNSAFTGHAELRQMYQGGVGAKTHKPFIQNHVIELDGPTEASGRCSVEIRIFQEGTAMTAAGHYLDRYRVEDGRWKLADRFYNAYHLAPWETGWTR